MKSVEYNFQLKQCGLYKAPPFQVRWGNIKLFYNGYIVCTQKNIWIHVSCQALFGIFSKRGKLSFLQRKTPKRLKYHISCPLRSSPNVKRPHLPYSLGCQVAGWQGPGIFHGGSLSLNWGEYGSVPSAVTSVLQKCVESPLTPPWGNLERWVRPCLDLSALGI